VPARAPARAPGSRCPSRRAPRPRPARARCGGSAGASYALFIPEAYKDGQTKNTADYLSISTRLEGLVKQVLAQNNAFQKLEGPLVSTEKQCIA
jgi:hypothetical protein